MAEKVSSPKSIGCKKLLNSTSIWWFKPYISALLSHKSQFLSIVQKNRRSVMPLVD